MSVPVFATMFACHPLHRDYCMPTEDHTHNNNLRYLGFTIYEVLDPHSPTKFVYSQEKQDNFHAVLSAAVLRSSSRVTAALSILFDLYSKHNVPLPAYSRQTIIDACLLDRKLKGDDRNNTIEVDLLWDYPLFWRAVEVLSLSQYCYSLGVIGRDRGVVSSKIEKAVLSRSYFRPFGYIVNEARRAVNTIRPNYNQ